MNYSRRIVIAFSLSLLAHGALLLLFWRPVSGSVETPEPEQRRMIVHLREDAPRFIETHTPADEPPEEAAYISTQDARAMDMTADETPEPEEPGPTDLPLDEVDVAPRQPVIAPEEVATAPSPPFPAHMPPRQDAPPTQKATTTVDDETADREDRFEVARTALLPRPDPPAASPPAGPKPMEKPPEEPRDDGPPQEGRTRVRGRTVTHGMTNFEALRHDLAPYLDQVKKAVERRWIEMLLMRYSGTSPTRAEIFCAIAPDGTLVEASIVGMPKEYLFAGLCRDAVQRAAPFPPFPFQVPDIYRNQNLQITWHFSFL